MDDYLNYLKAFNLEVFLELEWDTIEYIKDSASISLGSVKLNRNDKKKIIFMTKQKLENKEIIGRLVENIFTLDLLNGNLKNIEIKT